MDCGQFMDLSNADALALLNKTSESGNGMALNMSEMGGMAQILAAVVSMFQNRRPLAGAQEPAREAKVEDPEPMNVPAPVLVVPEPEPEPLSVPVPVQVSAKRTREPEEQEVLEPLRKRVLRVEVPSEEDQKHDERAEEWMPNDGTQWYMDSHSEVAPRMPTPRSARNVFAASQRQTVNAEQVSDHIAPTNMPNLPPVIILTRAQCEEKVRELEAIFKVGLSRPEILAMRSAVATAKGYIKKLRLQIAEREAEAKVGEQLEEVFQYCDTLRQLAASRAVKRAVLASFPPRAVVVRA